MSASWIGEARRTLTQLRGDRPGWGYQAAGMLSAEPTVLASLALRATEDAGGSGGDEALQRAAAWLAEIQQPDGSVGVAAHLPEPAWTTPYAVLLWAASGGFHEQRGRAIQWLLQCRGETWPRDPTGVVGHDTSIPGWPWVAGTHSWLEPTVTALLALGREGLAGHPRARDGIRLVCDRAIPGGAWNFGSSVIFGAKLRPQPAPTGMALLALANTGADPRIIQSACQYLEQALPRVRAPQSLAWGLLGLTAWGRRPAQADAWLAESFRPDRGGPQTPMKLAQLLLAATGRSLDLLVPDLRIMP